MNRIDFNNDTTIIDRQDVDFIQQTNIDMIGKLSSIMSGNNSILRNKIILDNKLLNYSNFTPNINTHWEYKDNDAFVVNNKPDVYYEYLTINTVIREVEFIEYINQFIVNKEIYRDDNFIIKRLRNFIQIEGNIIYNKTEIENIFHETTELESSGKWIKLSNISEEHNIPRQTTYTAGYGTSSVKSFICIIGRDGLNNIIDNHSRTPINHNPGDIFIYIGFIPGGTEYIKINYNNQIAI